MASKPKKRQLCAICGGRLRKTLITHAERRGGKLYLLRKVPAKVCGACGEIWIAGETLAEINRLIREGEPVRKIETPVYDFVPTGTR